MSEPWGGGEGDGIRNLLVGTLWLSLGGGQELSDLFVLGVGWGEVIGGAQSYLTLRRGGIVTACQSWGPLGNGSEATGGNLLHPWNLVPTLFLGCSVLTPHDGYSLPGFTLGKA